MQSPISSYQFSMTHSSATPPAALPKVAEVAAAPIEKPADKPFSAKLAALQSFVLLATLGIVTFLAILQARSLRTAKELAAQIKENRETIVRHVAYARSISYSLEDLQRELAADRAEAKRRRPGAERGARLQRDWLPLQLHQGDPVARVAELSQVAKRLIALLLDAGRRFVDALLVAVQGDQLVVNPLAHCPLC